MWVHPDIDTGARHRPGRSGVTSARPRAGSRSPADESRERTTFEGGVFQPDRRRIPASIVARDLKFRNSESGRMSHRRFAALERWMRTKELRACVPSTLRRYRQTVEAVLRSMARCGRPLQPSRWTLDDALWIKSRPQSHRWSLSIVSDFARSFGNDVIREAGIPSASSPIHVRWLSRNDAETILRATRGDPLLSFITMLGLGQGLRRVEWQRLRLDDVDLTGNRLLVRGKGRAHPKLQWVPLHPGFPEVYRQYVPYRERLIAEAHRRNPDCAVPSEAIVHRSPAGLAPYSSGGLDLLVRDIERKARAMGASIRLSSHMFRRSGATLLEEALLETPRPSPDGIYRVIQGFLRHENLATTMRYLESNPARQRRALARFAQALPWPEAPTSFHRPGRKRQSERVRARRDPERRAP